MAQWRRLCCKGFGVAAMALWLGGCASQAPQSDLILSFDTGLPQARELANVPFFPQDAYQCGPAALAMALDWSGERVTPEDLVAQVYSPGRKGSLPPEMVSAARRHGRVAYPVSDMLELLAEVASGRPVVVLQNVGVSWAPVWHYAVVIGYDMKREEVLLHSGIQARLPLPIRDFERSWEQASYWGLVVLPPGRLPVQPNEQRYLEAVLGLERAGRWREAATAYEAVWPLWPGSLGILIGLGNSHYAVGDRPGAERAFRDAVRFHPDSAAARNNLAQVLAESGHKPEAREQAQKAVLLGGPDAETYRATLKDIDG